MPPAETVDMPAFICTTLRCIGVHGGLHVAAWGVMLAVAVDGDGSGVRAGGNLSLLSFSMRLLRLHIASRSAAAMPVPTAAGATRAAATWLACMHEEHADVDSNYYGQ